VDLAAAGEIWRCWDNVRSKASCRQAIIATLCPLTIISPIWQISHIKVYVRPRKQKRTLRQFLCFCQEFFDATVNESSSSTGLPTDRDLFMCLSIKQWGEIRGWPA
jgi:hypothetical protein